MPTYKINKRGPSTNTSDGKFQTWIVNLENGQMIKYNEFAQILNRIQTSATNKGKQTRVYMRGMTIDGMKTLKGFNTDIISLDDFNEYFDNRVQDVGKFNEVGFLEIGVVSF